ncbi:MAG: aminopeptidase N [Gammaproteobacteria bacterium]|nr:aminopeptidase N [Gammaproteobacteria bacterium]NIR23664.1 aminopeptidase N [Gammaproteobacteria bacterium]NIS05478.1 aminopeptidase N [Gammaproteobacteria bacterium]NIU41861.1 aminopeptidase N [Gammaproteobacteria bacterium]NIV47592.1 aminopeptidase N [Gammaproteobacteria bacterium]
MSTHTPKTIRLEDYRPPPFLIDEVDLELRLDEDTTVVTSTLSIARNPASDSPPDDLVLDGQELELVELAIDGTPIGGDRYRLDEHALIVRNVPGAFTLRTVARIHPGKNTSLEGLYTSSGNFCTQCEAEGFRKITWFLDRPDVMSRYTTTIVADRHRYPVLLSNGNPVDRGTLDDDRHWVKWQDPFRKPCYLFALVAGNLACVEDRFTTRSGREVALRIYIEPHNADKCEHAMISLKKAMRWDEEVYGLEYDLDIYMIVAVDDFNMGAMENKGLNVFNSKYVLAKPETATDADFAGIEGVIAHEYFHNWTGNRVTCRDWFQLSLKEGLTVFRDQQFSADMTSPAVKRIQDVRVLRTHQFAEDAGPMAHPVRPDSYIEISNFYTVTVYNKGAEVIRMMHSLLGAAGFRNGMDLYFRRHDGEAVTTEDFVKAMEDANGADLSQFRLWYSQAGTPMVRVSGTYDADAKVYTLTLSQSCPATPGQAEKEPFHIPLRVGLLDDAGGDMALEMENLPGSQTDEVVLSLTEPEQRFRFVNVAKAPMVSVARDFSAPVIVEALRSDTDLAFLAAHDRDPFNRWDAAQEFATSVILRHIGEYDAASEAIPDAAFVQSFARTLNDQRLDRALVAEALTLPGESYLADRMHLIDVDAIHRVRQSIRRHLASTLEEDFRAVYRANFSNEAYRYDAQSAGRRSLKNLCLSYLMVLEDSQLRGWCLSQFHQADNMTDVLAALACFTQTDCPERSQAVAEFHDRWKHDTLVLDKWFTLQAMSHLPDTLKTVEKLMQHPAFDLKNPNKVRSLIGAFCHGNQIRFHDAKGAGYRFLADRVLELDSINAQVAARLMGAFSRWRKFDDARQGLMKTELERILATSRLSKDVYEITSKTLA